MNGLLQQILASVQERRRDRVADFSPAHFIKSLPTLPPIHPQAIIDSVKEKFFLITECKQASPSKGVLCANYNPREIALEYQAGGASAISVLTEEKFFQGSPSHLEAVRKSVSLPLLWKDFILHEEQVAEARSLGANILLLIFRTLSANDFHRILTFTIECNLRPLVEVFVGDDPEHIVKAMKPYSGQCLIGINNRDLATFHTDIKHSEKMYNDLASLHSDFDFISESGIETSKDIHRVKKVGFRGALVGESLVKKNDHRAAVRELLAEVE